MSEEDGFDLTDLDGPAWVRLDGTFAMGSEDGRDDERPVHDVRLSAYHISTFPVTNAQYGDFVRERDAGAPEAWSEQGLAPDRADHPVNYVSWNDAQAFCTWLTERVGAGSGRAGLPTEAQWEHAARGADGRRYPWGDDEPTPERANFRESRVEGTTPVDAYPKGATPEGVHDIVGNVREWCRDWYGRYEEGVQADPTGPDEGIERVLRGGSFIDAPGTLRTTYRANTAPENRFAFIGFRVVWSEPE